MDFPLRLQLKKALTEKEGWISGWINLYETLALDFLYASPNDLVIFPDNHDMPRFFAQVGEDIDLFQLGLAFIATTRGVPQLYYGTEVLMAGPAVRNDGMIRSDFPGGWQGDKVNSFSGQGLSKKQKAAQAWVKNLLNWRKTATAVHTGKLVHFLPEDATYVYFRKDARQCFMVVLNKNEKPFALNLERFKEELNGFENATDVLTGKKFDLKKALPLPPKGPLILELK